MATTQLSAIEADWSVTKTTHYATVVATGALASNSALDSYLLSNSYAQGTIDKMTRNDKVFAARQVADLAGTRGF